jgi:hypothetical protein
MRALAQPAKANKGNPANSVMSLRTKAQKGNKPKIGPKE